MLINTLKYLRIGNISLVILVFLLVQYALLPYLGKTSLLSFEDTLLIIFSLACITTFGNLQNDAKDKIIDEINCPNKSVFYQQNAYFIQPKFYWALGVFGVALGFFVSFKNAAFLGASIFLLAILCLHSYNTLFKKILLLGNIIVSFLVGLIVLLPLFFLEADIFFYESNPIVWTYFFVCFFINLQREIIKDIQDRRGDHKVQAKTFVLVVGIERTKKLLLALQSIGVLIMILLYFLFFPKSVAGFIYLFILCTIYLFVLFQTQLKTSTINWNKISNYYKLLLLMGSLSLVGFYFS